MKIKDWELEIGELIIYTGNTLKRIKLTPLEYKIFKYYKDEKFHRWIDGIRAVYKLNEDNTKNRANMKELIHRTNKKIKPIGKIENWANWGHKFMTK